MALTERTRPYETLIRHKEDGTIGAHHVQITEILRDKVVISATIGEALPLAVAEGQNGLKLADILGQAAAAALIQVETLQSQLNEQKAEADEAYAKMNAMTENTAGVGDKIEALMSKYDQMEASAQKALADLLAEQEKSSSLSAQVSLLKKQLNALLDLKSSDTPE